MEEIYKIKQIEARLKEIVDKSSDFRIALSEVTELVQIQLTWIGSNLVFPDHMPPKTVGGMKRELALLNFSNKVIVRLLND